MDAFNNTRVKGAANTTEARHSDSIGPRYSTYDALARTDIGGRSPLHIDLALDSHPRGVDYPLLIHSLSCQYGHM